MAQGTSSANNATYTPEHHGIAERANRTIMEMVRCMQFDAKMGPEFWGLWLCNKFIPV